VAERARHTSDQARLIAEQAKLMAEEVAQQKRQRVDKLNAYLRRYASV
jgi:hypothetical protein